MSAANLVRFAGATEIFRLLFDAAPDATVVTARDGSIVLVNTQAETLFGYSREELLGQKVELLVPQRLRRRHVKHRAVFLSHASVRPMGSDLELYGQRRDGTQFPIDVSLSPLDTGGEMLVSSSIRDITERKRSEEMLSHLAGIVEATDDAIIGISLDCTVLSWNTGAERLYGFKREEVVGRHLSRLETAGRIEQMAEIRQRLSQGEHIEQLEITQLHRDGHPIEISMTVSAVKDRAGAVVGASIIARDITRQKRSEEALRQNEERFRVAFKNAPVAVFNQDTKLRYTWIHSPGLAWGNQDYLGHTDAEILGGEEGARLTAIKKEVLRSGLGARSETELSFMGETYYFDLVVEPLRDFHGTILGLTSSATDITSAKKNLLERERLIVKLQEALEEVKLLSGLLSICASCKKIKNEHGVWEPFESYLQKHSEARFSHGLCPDCLRKLYPEQYQRLEPEVTEVAAPRRPKHQPDVPEAKAGGERTRK